VVTIDDHSKRTPMSDAIDVLVITALKEELDAVLDIDEGAISPVWLPVPDDAGYTYYLRDFAYQSGGTFRVAAARATDMGKAPAAEAASRLVAQLHPRCLAMCGVCAGWRKKVAQGDVIVAQRLYEWDKGKVREFLDRRGKKQEEFEGDLTTYNLHPVWRQQAEDFPYDWSTELVRKRPPTLESQRLWLLESLLSYEVGEAESPAKRPDRTSRCPSWKAVIEALQRERRVSIGYDLRLTDKGRAYLDRQHAVHPDGPPSDRDFRVHVAPLASGDKVIEDREIFPRLAKSVRKVSGLEMEGAAIGLVAEANGLPMIVAKGVQDYADLTKDDTFREFACAASAAFLLTFLRHHLESLHSRGPGHYAVAPALKPGATVDTSIRVSSNNVTYPDRPTSLLVGLLGRYVPDLEAFLEVSRNLGLGLEPLARARTPMTRWEIAVALCLGSGKVSDLMAVLLARSDLRAIPRLWRLGQDLLASKEPRMRPEIDFPFRDRSRLERELSSFHSAAFVQAGLDRERRLQAVRDALGLWSCRQIWSVQPLARQSKELCDCISEIVTGGQVSVTLLEEARCHGWLDEDHEFMHPGFATALAADYLLRYFAARPTTGNNAAVEKFWGDLDRLTVGQREVLGLLLQWDAATRQVVERLEAELFAQQPQDLSASAKQRVLLRLEYCDQLQGDAQLTPSKEDPLSVRWAYKAGLQSQVASLLECIEEKRLVVYLRHYHLAEVGRCASGRAALANAIRRLVRHDSKQEALPIEGTLSLAVHCALSGATAADLERLSQQPPALDLWMDILPFPADDAQFAILRTSLAGSRHERDKAAERLVLEPDLLRVWQRLGTALVVWVTSLPPWALRLESVAFLRKQLDSSPVLPAGERQALDLLRSRLDLVR
jgi:nucleoside phosphorylase